MVRTSARASSHLLTAALIAGALVARRAVRFSAALTSASSTSLGFTHPSDVKSAIWRAGNLNAPRSAGLVARRSKKKAKEDSDKDEEANKFKELRESREGALARVEELEVVAELREEKLAEEQEKVARAKREKARALSDVADATEKIETLRDERDKALAEIEELKATLEMEKARAKGLEDTLSIIGSSVGAALKDASLSAGDLSLYDTAVRDSSSSKQRVKILEKEQVQASQKIADLQEDLTESRQQSQTLAGADARAAKLAEGLKEMYARLGAKKRAGIFGMFGIRSEDEMIKDSLAEIDELKRD